MRITWFLSILVTVTIVAAGCEKKQLERADVIVGDVNDIVAGVGALLESPAGAMLPPDIRLYAAAGVALVSIAVNSWQGIKGSLMKKTTKAIVRGIESADKPKANPMSKVKKSIQDEMILAGIFDRGDKLVDKLKLAR